MTSNKLILEEMETIINYNRSSPTASIYTSDPVMMRRLDKLTEKTPLLTQVKADEYGRWYECPKTMIKVHAPRVLTEQESKKRASRMKGVSI